MSLRFQHIFFLVFCLSSCSKTLLHDEFDNNPLSIYDACWSEFDRNYGSFEAKHINWDSLRLIYRSQLTPNATNEQLYSTLTSLLKELNDGHVELTAPGFKRFFSVGAQTIFPDSKYYENGLIIKVFFELIRKKYVSGIKSSGAFFKGYLNGFRTSKNIGYLYVSSFALDNYPRSFIDSAVAEFKDADAIILDLRFNGGGSTGTFLSLLNHFADERRMYLKSKLRNGPQHSNFTELYSHYTWPEFGAFKAKPVMVLVNRFSASSSEHFLLGMQAFPYVTTIGDTTYGALSTVIQKVLPNGWEFRSCPQVLCDSTGQYLKDSHGRYPDGIGLCPDIWVPNYYKDLLNGQDLVMERALKEVTN